MLYIFDRDEKVVGFLQSNSDRNKNIYYDDVLTEILSSGADSFAFTAISDRDTSKNLTVGNYIAFKKGDKFKLMQIMEVNESRENVLTKEIYCEGAGLELINTVYSGSKMSTVNIESFLKNVLQDTNWEVGYIDSNLTKTLSLEIEEKEVYSIIQEYLYDFEAEIDFRVEIKGNRIVGRYIDVYSKRGRNNGRRLEINRDIKSISRKVSLTEYATKLIGEGKNGLNFRDISMSGEINKPLGQNFVVNEEAYSRINNKGKHITRKFTYDTEDAYELLRQTYKALKEYSEPKVTYEVDADILNFDDIEIGDYVSISDLSFTPPLLVTARISELETSKTNKYANKAILSNFNEVRSGISSIFPIPGDNIVSGSIGGEQMSPDYVDSIISDSVNASLVKTEILLANKADIEDLNATNANINNLKANFAEIDELLAGNITADNIKADSITSNHIQANAITSGHIQADTITSGHIQSGAITAGSGIIADGAIGNAQISKIDAGKIEAGTIDTSKVTIQGANGHLRLKGNRMQVFQGVGNQAKERVSVGDVNGDGTIYGLRVRGADGQTVLLDENGVTSEGITDGSITNDKINEDANIDGAKLNINSVINKINTDGTEVIQGTKVEVDGTNLGVKLSEITNKQTSDGEKITQAQAQITANQNAIKLKVDEQIYTTDKNAMTSKLEKNTSDINVLKDSITMKVDKTEIDNVKDELGETIDTKITDATAELKVTTDGISQKVGKLETTTTTLSGKVVTANQNATDAKNTANTANNNANQALTQITTTNNRLSSIESNVDSITSRVGNVETITTTLDGKVTNQETRLSEAEQKITDRAITSVVKESQFIKDMDGKISTNKSNISKIEQTANSITSRVDGLDGKYTQLKQTVDGIDVTGKVSFSDLSTSGRTTINGSNITTGTINTNRVNIKGGTTKKIVIANDNYCVYDGSETDVNRKVFMGFRTNTATNVPSVMLGYNGINPSVDGAVVSGGTYTTYSHYPNNDNPEGVNLSYGALAFKYGAQHYQFSTLNMYQNGDVDLKSGASMYFRPNLRDRGNHVFAISDTSVGCRVPFQCTSSIYTNGNINTDAGLGSATLNVTGQATVGGVLNVKNGAIYGMNRIALSRSALYIPNFGANTTMDYIRLGGGFMGVTDNGAFHFITNNASRNITLASGTVYLPQGGGNTNTEHARFGAGIVASPSSGTFHFLTVSGNATRIYASNVTSSYSLEPVAKASNRSVFDEINSIKVIDTAEGFRLIDTPTKALSEEDNTTTNAVYTTYNEKTEQEEVNIDYTTAISTLWKAVQELKQEVEMLKNKNEGEL